MRLAAAAGSPDSNVAELSRYLLNRPDSSFIGFDVWERPDHDEQWYARLGKDPAVAALARRFIADALPHDSIYYHVSLLDDLDRIATNLTSAYLDTAATMVRYGVASSSDVVLAGALRDLEGFEPIVDAAVEACTLTDAQQKEADENRITLINEVYNSDYAEHLAQNDDGYTAWEFLEGYVDAARKKHGWRFLVNHRHENFLRPHWLRSLSIETDAVTPSSDELLGAFACVSGSEHEETFWGVIQSHWRNDFEQKLLCRIREGSCFSSVRHSASACLLKHTPDSLVQAVNSLKNDGNHERIIELMIDLADTQKFDNDDRNIDASAAIENLDPLYKELYYAASSFRKDTPPSLSKASSNLLRNVSASSVSIRMLRIRMHKVFSDIVGEDIEWILSHSDDKALCIEAISAAVCLGMSGIIQAALSHKFAHVVAKALTARAEEISAPLPDELLSLMSKTGSPVRRALATALLFKPHQEHLPALLHLVKDQWSTFSRHYGEDDYFPIARLAAEAIANMDSIGHDVLQELQAIALESSDRAVRLELLCTIAAFGGTPLQRWLAELAIKPGRIQLRRAAARALVAKCLQLDIAIIRSLSTDVLLTVPYTVAPLLTIAAAVRLTPDERIQLARGLATNPQRRALVLLLLWRELESTDEAIHAIESLLPRGHSSISWISKGLKEVAQDDLIADLGEPELCHAVLELLNPKPVKT